MQALVGVVIKCRPDSVEIELQSGTVLKAKGNPKFRFGSKVLVLYDFTRMKVRNIILENEWYPGDESTPPDEEQIDEGVDDPKLLEYYAGLAEENL